MDSSFLFMVMKRGGERWRIGSAGACLDAALVYEGISPPAELPVGMEDTKQNREICMNRPNHPQ